MAEDQKQKQGPNLEDRLLEIGSLMQLRKGINKSKNPGERFPLYQILAQRLAPDYIEYYRNQGENINPEEAIKVAYGDIRISPEEALRYAVEGTQKRVNDTKSLYEGKNKNKIIKDIVSAMEKDIKNSKSIDEAAEKLSIYLRGLFQTPELDQITADEYAQKEAAEALGVSMNFSARGSIEKYRGRHEGLYARAFAHEYLKENKENDKIIYSIDKDKIGKIMDKVEGASLLYTNYINLKAMKEAMKQQKEPK